MSNRNIHEPPEAMVAPQVNASEVEDALAEAQALYEQYLSVSQIAQLVAPPEEENQMLVRTWSHPLSLTIRSN